MENRFISYSHRICILVIFLLLFSPVNIYILSSKPDFKNDIDSLQSLVQKCPTDIEKSKVLYKYFWRYAYIDIERVKNAETWGFEIIKIIII